MLRTAWLIDKHKDYKLVRKDIAAIKVAMPKVYHDIATTALHMHGALGVSNEMPFMGMVTSSLVMGIADGPTEVHKVTVAKQVLQATTSPTTTSSPPITSPSCARRPGTSTPAS